MSRRLLSGLAIAAMILGPVGCGVSTGSPTPRVAPIIVTFEVADDQRFKVLLTDPAAIKTAADLLAGEDVPSIPNGRVIRQTGVNTGYSWSLDPNDIRFTDETDEDCDGSPSDVESGQVPGDRYCPSAAQVVAIDAAP